MCWPQTWVTSIIFFFLLLPSNFLSSFFLCSHPGHYFLLAGHGSAHTVVLQSYLLQLCQGTGQGQRSHINIRPTHHSSHLISAGQMLMKYRLTIHYFFIVILVILFIYGAGGLYTLCLPITCRHNNRKPADGTI